MNKLNKKLICEKKITIDIAYVNKYKHDFVKISHQQEFIHKPIS